ncbi:PEP-CTERM protein-sorting domain-containing protein [Nitrosomonas oligotropha]|uniref:PEP-CTERM protein-sorting domain-containing protein n=1 Tax=Nitrosomonas oligotropha TaxID=42354 RepID=A0A1H8KQ08_9PROT|nr:PEP-CTERM protein-sorting domain-containing protein [Nitrosomonas oligotropha]SEN94957.1 PEP-CTERM protein-sorting domain-containing protein [Nitrosomonas oligotropha]
MGTSSSHGNNDSRAFVTGANGAGMIDLGAMGGDWSAANGINNLGQVIGAAGYGSYGSNANAFIYSNGVMVNLSYLDVVIEAGWTSLYAKAINDNGQIVGFGILDGVSQAFLLSGADDEDFYRSYVPFPLTPLPVPEPSTYAMLLAGLGLGLLFFRTKTELNS